MDLLRDNSQSKSPSTLSTVYLLCLIVSIVVSWGIFFQFVTSDQASFIYFFELALANPVSVLLSSDILLTAPIFLFFASKELKRLGMPSNRLAIYFLVTFSVGICASLSLFLYQREIWQRES